MVVVTDTDSICAEAVLTAFDVEARAWRPAPAAAPGTNGRAARVSSSRRDVVVGVGGGTLDNEADKRVVGIYLMEDGMLCSVKPSSFVLAHSFHLVRVLAVSQVVATFPLRLATVLIAPTLWT